ncbi:hypothetical protein CBR_g29476 [Chara braunii]|uniref:Protein kinase domain-containing protein n=1 Tax=Chara braunii TaxID=69332 RepID=A0A388LAL1_CHABU|nr:hypothetical protein CBR_g29476 [Chara braunii]|eukprot:GBG79326.1 hypothetical protein CBR_g29476 [Chara braunii]
MFLEPHHDGFLRVHPRIAHFLNLFLTTCFFVSSGAILLAQRVNGPDEAVERRKLGGDVISLNTSAEPQLIRSFIDVLSWRDDLPPSTNYAPRIYDVDASSSDGTVFYIEWNATQFSPNTTTMITQSMIKSASLTSTGQYHVSNVAGPWAAEGGRNNQNSSHLAGILVFDDNTLLVSDIGNSTLQKVDIRTGQVEAFTRTEHVPVGLSKHPTKQELFVSSYAAITRLNFDSQLKVMSMSTLAGADNEYRRGLTDADTGSEVQFNYPIIGHRSISPTGKSLYVADWMNNAIRKVDTEMGATKTIAGTPGINGSRDGPHSTALFMWPSSLALTSDGCNLFVAEWGSGRIRWLKLDNPDGDVLEVRTVAIAMWNNGSNAVPKGRTINCVTLSKDDQHIFTGAGGQIFKLTIDKSALHQCGSRAAGRDAALVVPLTVGLVAAFIVIAIAVVLWKTKRSNKCIGVFGSDSKRQESSNNIEQCTRTSSSHDAIELPTSNLPRPTPTGTGDSGRLEPILPASALASDSEAVHRYEPAPNELKRFSLPELQRATKDFSEDHLLAGKGGGYGDVYRALVMVGRELTDVAIKVMRGEFNNVKYKQINPEVTTLSQVRHRNLCKLLGFCMEQDKCILVYPFISGGSLHDRLHAVAATAGTGLAQAPYHAYDDPSEPRGLRVGSEADGVPLSWMERMSIARQVAAGLEYLHYGLEQPMLHRNVKSRNILIKGKGEYLHAYLIDFGLARPGEGVPCQQSSAADGPTPSTVAQSGTPGYIAPECRSHLRLTTTNDVYAFGVVLLELVTGQKAVMKTGADSETLLVPWARQWLVRSDLTYRQLHEIVDPLIKNTLAPWEQDMVHKLAMLGNMCTKELPEQRPSMRIVLRQVTEIIQEGPDQRYHMH